MITISKESTKEIKGIAILMVILGHLSALLGSSVFNYMGAFGVAIFLLLSGYGLIVSENRNGLQEFWKKRLLTVMIPYVTITLVWIVIDLCKGKIYPLKTYILLLIGFDPGRTIDATMWYISFILLWYVAFWLVCKCAKRPLLRVIYLFCASLFFCKFVEMGIVTNLSWQWYLHAFSFPIGVTVGTCFKDGIHKKALIGINIVTLLLIVILLPNIQDSMFVYMCLNIIIAIFVISLIMLKNHKRNSAKSLCLVGAYSYELYLVEGYCMRIFSLVPGIGMGLLFYAVVLVCLSFVQKKWLLMIKNLLK